jgi:radical SAM protein with 4Fe4S-binding SPASM domain
MCVNVLADGKVYACCVVNKQMEIGDLNTHSLPEIINSQAAVTLKERLLSGDIADLVCIDCCNAPMGSTEDLEASLHALFEN